MRKIISVALVIVLLFSSSAFAMNKAPRTSYFLSFSANTANCSASIIEKGKNISATMNLYESGSLVDTWSRSGSSSVTLSGSHTAKSGKTYKLVVNYTINGGSTQTVTTTKTCP